MRLAAVRCDDRPNIVLVAGVWSCSREKGHPGDHAFHAGHDLDTTAVFTWARAVAPYPPLPVAAAAPLPPRGGEYDEYDLIPDATAHELRTLPTLAEMDLRSRRRVASPVG